MSAAGCVSAYKLCRSWLHTTRIPALNIRVDYRGDIDIHVGNPQSSRKDRLEGQVFSAHWLACTLSHLFSSLNSPNSLSLSVCDRHSNPLPIFEVSCRTPFGLSCTKYPDSRCVPLALSRREGCPPSACQQHASSSHLVCCRPSLLQGHVAVTSSTLCLPAPSGLFLQSCCPAGQPPGNTGACATLQFFQRCLFLWWTSGDTCWPLSPACRGLSWIPGHSYDKSPSSIHMVLSCSLASFLLWTDWSVS